MVCRPFAILNHSFAPGGGAGCTGFLPRKAIPADNWRYLCPIPKTPPPFSQQLAYINKGTLDAELTEALAEVIKAVRETGKKGAVTLTLNCSMLNTRDENTMKVTPKVSRTIPELDRADTIMFSTADGDLLRDDPAQVQMDLKVIEQAPQAAPIKLAQ